jgi:hypothetical protein
MEVSCPGIMTSRSHQTLDAVANAAVAVATKQIIINSIFNNKFSMNYNKNHQKRDNVWKL